MKIEQVPIADLVLDPNNARTHDETNLDAIKNSLKRFGQQKPIVISGDKIVIAGNGTLSAAKALGWKEIACVVSGLLTADEQKAYALVDNKTTDLSTWDEKQLDKSLRELAEFEMSDFGFDMSFLDEPKEDDGKADDVPEIELNVHGVKGADIWQLGQHTLMCGDSTNLANIKSLLGKAKIDLIYTDPPYGINRDVSERKNSLCLSNKNLKNFDDISIDTAANAFKACVDLKIKRQVWWGANYYCHHLPQTANWFVWDKRVEEKHKDVNSDCELAWVKSKWASVRIFRHLWRGLMKHSENGQKRVHPTQKPIALAEWSFDYFKDVQTVLDLFCGSGSTLIACEKTGRVCYGMEIDPHYCSVIIERWQRYTGKTAKRVE